MTWLLTALGGARRLFGLVAAYPLQAALIVAVAASVWLYCGKADALATIAQMKQDSKDATAAQVAMNAERTRKDTDNAKQSDSRYVIAQAAAGDATIRYIERWRVRPDSCRGQADSATESGNTEVLAAMSAGTVLVSERDVQACSAATVYAIEAHNHAVSQIETGVAVPVE